MGSEIWDMIGTYRLTWGYSVFFCLSEKRGLPNPWRIIIFPIAMLLLGGPSSDTPMCNCIEIRDIIWIYP
jgi:hypothetical protein